MSFEISPGERMLWEEKPQRLRGFLRSMDVFLLIFILFIGLFFATATAGSATRDASPPLLFFFFPFIFFGFFLFGRRPPKLKPRPCPATGGGEV